MSYIDDILNAIPEPVRQLGAGVATIPSETARAGVMLANPMRTYRALVNEPLPGDSQGVLPAIENVANQYNSAVNRGLHIEDPSILDNTLSAGARFLGGAIPRAPIAVASKVVQNAPAIVRGAAHVAEALTPITWTSRTGTARIAPIAANVLAPMAVGGAVESAVETSDPTQPVIIHEPDGSTTTIHPVQTAGAGRTVARNVRSAIEDDPTGSAIGAGLLVGGAILGRRALNRTAAVRAESTLSDVNQPSAIGREVATGAEGTVERTVEALQDQGTVTKRAVRQSLPQDPGRAAQINALVGLDNDQAHLSIVQGARSQGIVDTPGGRVAFDPLDRVAEELTHYAGSREPEFRRKVDDAITLQNEADIRRAHQLLVDELERPGRLMPNGRQANKRVWTKQEIAKETNHLVEYDSDRPRLDANGNQLVVNGVLQFEKEYRLPRVELHDMDDATVFARADAAANDAEVAPWLQRYRRAIDPALEVLKKFEAISDDEAKNMRKANPHYRHMINFEDGSHKSPFTTRLRGDKEGAPFGGDPWASGREYLDAAISFAHGNYMKRNVLEAVIDGQKQGLVKGFVGKYADPRELRRTMVATSSPNTQGGYVMRQQNKTDIKLNQDQVVRFKVGGDLVEVEVPNKSMYNTLNVAPQHASNMWTWAKGLAQSVMTGKIATLMLQPFAFASATMNSVFAMLTRPKNIPLGALDRTTLAITGGRFGLRGDPTAYVGMAKQAAYNVSAVMSRAFSEAIYNSIAAGGYLSKIPNAQGLADRLARAFRESMYAQQFRAGAGEVSNMGGDRLDNTKRSGFTQGQEYAEQARVVSPRDPSSFKQYLQTLGKTAVPASAKAAWRVFEEIQNAISSAPQSYAFASNPLHGRIKRGQLTPEQAFRETSRLSAEVRQLLGDPAQVGTALRYGGTKNETSLVRAAGGVIGATPYANISIQAIGRLAHAFKQDFVGTSAAIGMTLGPIVIAPLANAWRLDKEREAQGLPPLYLPWELGRAAWHQARYAVVHIQGVDPSLSPQMRLDPTISPLIAAAREAIWWALGIAGNAKYEPGAVDMGMRWLNQYAGERTRANLSNALWNAVPISQFPTPVTAGFAAAGIELPAFTDIMSRGGGIPINERGLGGYEETRQQGGLIGKRLETVIQAIFPGLGALLGGMLNTGTQAERGQPGTFARGALQELKGRSRDRLPEMNSLLWEQPGRRPTTDPTSVMVNERVANLEKIRANISSVRAPGTIGSGRNMEADPLGGGRAGVGNPVMDDLLQTVNGSYRSVEKLIAERKTERDRLISLSQRPNLAMSFVDRRRAENTVADRIVSLNRQILAEFYTVEEQLSSIYGRSIRIDKIDPTKSIEQFPRLSD